MAEAPLWTGDKVIAEQRAEASKETSQGGIWRKSIPGRGTSRGKALKLEQLTWVRSKPPFSEMPTQC